jgi:hypothetical protein
MDKKDWPLLLLGPFMRSVTNVRVLFSSWIPIIMSQSTFKYSMLAYRASLARNGGSCLFDVGGELKYH